MGTEHIKNCIAMLEKIPDLRQEADMINSETGSGFTAAILYERAEQIEAIIKSFKEELRLRKLGKPVGEEPLSATIQQWEVRNFSNNN